MSPHRTARGGFTLLEMSIILAIVGMMTAYGMHYSGRDLDNRCIVMTKPQLARIQRALEQFVVGARRLPRPAGKALDYSSAFYGREAPATTDSSIDRAAGPPAVLFGAVPFASLHLTPEDATDCWGNQLTYAVDETLTSSGNYPDGIGGLEIRNGTLSTYSVLTAKAAYILISHGPDGTGATPRHGTSRRNCNSQETDPAYLHPDKENCDTNNGVFFANSYHDGNLDSTFFDDIVLYDEKPPITTTTTNTTPGDVSCAADDNVTWGGNCSAPSLLTLAGLSVELTNVNSGYTGVAISTCLNGSRITLGTCLPIGTCTGTNPRNGSTLTLLTGVAMLYGTGVCQKYSCCSGTIKTSTLTPCPLLDTVGLASGC